MIYAVKMPQQDRIWLQEAVELQIEILRIAANLMNPISEDGSELRDALRNHPKYSSHVDEITKWIIRKDGYQPGKRKPEDTTKPSSFFGNLQAFAAHNDIAAKIELCDAVCHDVDLLNVPEAKAFQADFTSAPWQKAAGIFLSNWYDVWSKQGLDHFLLRKYPREKYSRAEFVHAFITANPGLYVCPICDASAYRNETSSGTYTSIDHYFPRRRHPHLSLHPYNLLPMCPACNSGEAGQRDPANGLTSITDLILPYHNTSSSLAKSTYASLAYRPIPADEENVQKRSHPLKISLNVASNPGMDANLLRRQIQKFESIYAIEARWNKDNSLTLIEEHVFRRIRQFLLSDIERGEPLHDPQFLLERLELLTGIVDQQNLGQEPFSFMTIWWLLYHVKCLELCKDEITQLDLQTIDCSDFPLDGNLEPLFVELYCWAQEQQQAFAELYNRVEELRSRIGFEQ